MSASEREVNATLRRMQKALAAAQADNARLLPFARFGSWAFEAFWGDGEPGCVEAEDAQEFAVEIGLLGRTSEVDASATHAEGCDYSPDAPLTDCCCFTPLRSILSRAPGGTDALRVMMREAWHAGSLHGMGGCNPADGPPWDEDDDRRMELDIARLLPEAAKEGAER